MFRKNLTIILLLVITAMVSFSLAGSNGGKEVAEVTKASVVDANTPVNTVTSTPRLASPTKSTIVPQYQVVSSPYDDVILTVTLLDPNGSYVSGHKVNLISSSPKSKVSFVSTDVSDQKGQVAFKVNSYAQEAVTYAAYDIDSNVTLDSRSKIAYLDEGQYVTTAPKSTVDYKYAAVGAPSMVIDHFEFQGLPPTINPNEQATFTVATYDAANQPVTNYQGTITFSVKGSNQTFVILPADYVFKPEDLGIHTFSLALSFKQAGTYTVDVSDTTDPSVFGTHTFEVGTVVVDMTTSNISITSPLSGSYNNASQMLSGTATPGANLKVFENDIPMGDLTADASGNFIYTMGVLADGKHSVYVASVDETGATITAQSNIVDITIDTTPPEVSNVVLDPSDSVGPNEQVKVQLYAKETLSKAILSFNSATFTLAASGDFYETTIASPAITGKYPLDFTVADELGNETKVSGKVFLTVKMGNAPQVPDVTGVKVEAFDGRVVINWDVPQTALKIKNYRVHYGLFADQLVNVLDTFTDAPTWYIPGVQNGVQYFIAVTAVDEGGNESAHLSEIVSVIPNPTVVLPPDPCIAAGTCGTDNLHDLKDEPGKTGPEVTWLVALSLIGGLLYNVAAKRRDSLRK